MTLRFESIPLRPDGDLDLAHAQRHQTKFSAAECYLPSVWVSVGVFFLTSALTFILCFLVRQGGYHLVADGEESYLPPLCGLVLSLPAFTAALKFEVHLLMHMCALRDRDCDFGQFEFMEQGRW